MERWWEPTPVGKAGVRRMVERVEKLGVRPESVGADKAYGSGEFLAWLLARGVQPHIPVIDRRHQTEGRFTREQFRYDPAENAYYCPSIPDELVTRSKLCSPSLSNACVSGGYGYAAYGMSASSSCWRPPRRT